MTWKVVTIVTILTSIKAQNIIDLESFMNENIDK